MIYIFYLVFCIFLSILMGVLTKKNNREIEEIKKEIELIEKVNKAVERWEKRRCRRA